VSAAIKTAMIQRVERTRSILRGPGNVGSQRSVCPFLHIPTLVCVDSSAVLLARLGPLQSLLPASWPGDTRGIGSLDWRGQVSRRRGTGAGRDRPQWPTRHSRCTAVARVVAALAPYATARHSHAHQRMGGCASRAGRGDRGRGGRSGTGGCDTAGPGGGASVQRTVGNGGRPGRTGGPGSAVAVHGHVRNVRSAHGGVCGVVRRCGSIIHCSPTRRPAALAVAGPAGRATLLSPGAALEQDWNGAEIWQGHALALSTRWFIPIQWS
jgi:hypothetical protein